MKRREIIKSLVAIVVGPRVALDILPGLQSAAAPMGVLRTGAPMSEMVEYGQNFAAQEYGRVFNAALLSYDAQYLRQKGARLR